MRLTKTSGFVQMDLNCPILLMQNWQIRWLTKAIAPMQLNKLVSCMAFEVTCTEMFFLIIRLTLRKIRPLYEPHVNNFNIGNFLHSKVGRPPVRLPGNHSLKCHLQESRSASCKHSLYSLSCILEIHKRRRHGRKK